MKLRYSSPSTGNPREKATSSSKESRIHRAMEVYGDTWEELERLVGHARFAEVQLA